jgi:hypothetical protein
MRSVQLNSPSLEERMPSDVEVEVEFEVELDAALARGRTNAQRLYSKESFI